MSRKPTILDWLDEARDPKRRPMYFRSLEDMWSQISGYEGALFSHAVDEGIPSLGMQFAHWLYHTGRIAGASCGWAYAIGQLAEGEDEQFELFYAFLDEYRKLRPTKVASVSLGPRHQMTKDKIREDFRGLEEVAGEPTAIAVIQYRPERYHGLWFHLGKRFRYERFVFEKNFAGIETSLSHVFEQVEKRFGVFANEWVLIDE